MIIFVIGVSGAGKSTVGKALAETLHIPFFDGDDFHPESNIQKMSNGQPLNDEDRWGWLENLNLLARKELPKEGCVIACSALKQSYREVLGQGIRSQTEWVFLQGSFELIQERIRHRKNHFMGATLLQSQFEALEEPGEAFFVDIRLTSNTIVKKIQEHLARKSEFGLYGLGVMGKSLSRNLAEKGFHLSLFNRHVPGKEENVAIDFKEAYPELKLAKAFDEVKAFVNSLVSPRKIMLMVNAGKITDAVIEDLLPHLSEGDTIIDGGNSNFNDTQRRFKYLSANRIHFIGAGVSGGEEGALKGPSIMPGGDQNAYQAVKPYLEAIAARDKDNRPCCTYIGGEGSGHFVKMVHNGIEYAEMQLLAEVCTVFQRQGHDLDETASLLEAWKPFANSYLLEITVEILRKKEGADWLLNKILDKAGNKGTGNWAAITSAQFGVPSTMISQALNARYISFFKEERVLASQKFSSGLEPEVNLTTSQLKEAYQFARIVNHHQGFRLISEVSKNKEWGVDLSELARIWTQGCIIKSDLMKELVLVLQETNNILSHDTMVRQVESMWPQARKVVAESILNTIEIPCLSDAINYFHNYIQPDSSANIIQAQRDYFGAHTYQRKDDASGKYYHTNWNSE